MDIEVSNLINKFELNEGGSIDHLLQKLANRTDNIIFHETYHYWQGLRLPFLFWNAFISFPLIYTSFRKLSKHSNNFLEWSCSIPPLRRLNMKDTLILGDEDTIYWIKGETGIGEIENSLLLSPIDLLECAASLAEFQIFSTDEQRVCPAAFNLWIKRNPAYLVPFDFACSFLKDEALVLRVLLPLINHSFCTTEPTRAFSELLAIARFEFIKNKANSHFFLKQKEPCRWTEVMQSWLNRIDFEDTPDSSIETINSKFHRLTLDRWINATHGDKKGRLTHPLLNEPSARWTEWSKSMPWLTSIMDLPGWFIEQIPNCREAFSPPITTYRFNIEKNLAKTFLYGRGVKNWSFGINLDGENWNKKNWRGFMVELMTIHGAIRRASGTLFDGHQRTCYHENCPYYESNFCNSYPIIPSDWKKCGFPSRMEDLIRTHRRL